MQNLNKQNVRRKFNTFSRVLIVVLLFTGILYLILVAKINKGTTDVSKNWLPSVIIAEELNTATSNFRIAETSHVISQDTSVMLWHEGKIESIAYDIKDMFEEYENNLVTNEEDLKLIVKASVLWQDYLEVHAEMINYSRENSTDEAMAIMYNQSELLFNEVSRVFIDLVAFNKSGADNENISGDIMFYTAVAIIVVITVIFLFVFRKFNELMDEIERTQEKLKYAHEEATLSTKAKSNFLANMSHEIRTPMNAISGMTDIILRETTDREVTEYANNIKSACNSLIAIINDVLDISKIESGKLEVIEDEYNLSELLGDVLNIATNRLQDKELMFVTNFQNDLPNHLIGDSVRVKQIMVNILNNAIKFTEEGHISFDVSGSYSNGILDLKFSVTDTGQGISTDDIEKLFIEFERVNTTKNRSVEGTGLGLAISKRLCEMMEGDIQIESELHKGTTFYINIKQKYDEYIPLAEVEEPKSVLVFETRDLYRNSIEEACKNLNVTDVIGCSLQSELNEQLNERTFDYIFTSSIHLFKVEEKLAHSDAKSKIILLADNSDIRTKYDYTTILLPTNSISISNVLNGKTSIGNKTDELESFIAPKCKVLVVDDNLVNIKVAQGLMKPYKFSISTAENGEEAVDLIKSEHFDLVFMDHMMPVMDGVDATIAIREMKDEYYKNLPIVALTANAIIGTRDMFIREGMSDFLAKPIKINELNDILLKWLPKSKQIFGDSDIEEYEKLQAQDEVVQEQETDDKKLRISGVDTELGLKRIGGDFDVYIDILDMYCKDVNKRVLNIRSSLVNQELYDYKIDVHALKSSSASIGALNISEKARLLEEAAIKSNTTYIEQSTGDFLEDLDIVVKSIDGAIRKFIINETHDDKDKGDISLYHQKLEQLKGVLDKMDIANSEVIVEDIMVYSWDKDQLDSIYKIKDFLSEFEYDEAIEFIDEILSN